MNMTPAEALKILEQVAASFTASGKDHAVIREALAVLSATINTTSK